MGRRIFCPEELTSQTLSSGLRSGAGDGICWARLGDDDRRVQARIVVVLFVIAMDSKRGEASKEWCDDSRGTVEQSGKRILANEKLFDSD